MSGWLAWCWHSWCIFATQATTRGFQASNGWDVFRGRGHAENGHIIVDALVVSGFDQVGFVPDAHASISADQFIKTPPGFQMGIVFVASELFQVFKRAPVLHNSYAAPGAKGLRAWKTFLR